MESGFKDDAMWNATDISESVLVIHSTPTHALWCGGAITIPLPDTETWNGE